jgi:hypothetical protein
MIIIIIRVITQSFIINMLAQQPYGQLQRQHRNIRKIYK